ncbi:MAG TPA: hypothetical protein VMF59_13285 [Bacteroidota bacterium]|nr:hypothetical protein [Bacteroidota bacterium]
MKARGFNPFYLAPFSLSLFAAGCIPSESYTVNQLTLDGPIARTPINVTIDPQPGTIQVIPGFALNNGPRIRGSISPRTGDDAAGGTNSGTISPPGNLSWNIPSGEYSLDLQLTATRHVGVFLGGIYAATEGYQFANFRGGLAFFNVDENFAIRFDAGLQFNGLRYRSRATVTAKIDQLFGTPRQYVSNFDDTGTEQSVGAAFGLTINSACRESFVNGFLHVGVAWQPLIDYNPSRPDTVMGAGDARASVGFVSSTTAVLSFGGGIALELGRGNRALIGVRGAQLLDINSPAPQPVWQPFVEFVLSF